MSISTRLFSLQMLDQFRFIEGRLQDIQTQIATGSRIPQSSDQPMDAVTLSARNELDQRINQYQKNLGKVSERLGLVDSTLEEAVNISIRLKELFVASNTGTVTQVERMASREEVMQIKETLLGLANATDSSGDALFGGFSTEASPFRVDVNGKVGYHGDGGEHTLSVSENIKMPTSINGANVFMEIDAAGRKKTAFDILDGMANSMLTNDVFSQSLSADASDGLELEFHAARTTQNWSFTLSGPDGVAEISAGINSQTPSALIAEINNAQVGVSATLTAEGRVSLSATQGSIKISNIEIEGYNNAQTEPMHYVSAYDPSNGEQLSKLSDLSQGMRSIGPDLDALISAFALARTTAGARLRNAESQEAVLQSRSIAVQTEIGDLKDADIESLITELQTILVNRDAARQTYTSVSNQSLFDFLR